jgi:hypothetical protein
MLLTPVRPYAQGYTFLSMLSLQFLLAFDLGMRVYVYPTP